MISKYLVVKHWMKDTYMTDEISRQDLIDLKEGHIEAIIDCESQKEFDAKVNAWILIKKI